MEEYRDVLRRPKFGFDTKEVQSLERLLRDRGELVVCSAMIPVSPDPGDDKFIACALTARAAFLVTGNKRHYRESWLAGTRLVNAAELVQTITDSL